MPKRARIPDSPILVVAAHPDDEVLGCGGTIRRHTMEGDDVHVLILGEGATSRNLDRADPSAAAAVKVLDRAVRNAGHILGVRQIHRRHFPDNRFDSVDFLDIVKSVEEIVFKIRPGRIYTHFSGDLNLDHRLVHQAVLTAARPFPRSSVKTLLSFEVPSSTEWQSPGSHPPFWPQVFIDIKKTLPAKLKAMRQYRTEIRPYPHPRSTRAIRVFAERWGVNAGLEAAEAFMVMRDISSAAETILRK